jgi:dihydrofolate synthase/folylpolyglutamate synthase
MTTSADLIAALLARYPRRIDLSLDRMWHVLAALGDPHKHLPPTIHVAGTNGKGSTVAFMRAMLEAAGKTVHADTSPHLVRYNERIRLAGTLVTDAQLADAFARCEAANGSHPITIWELMTAAAFLLFAEIPADVLLLEVGLGGRYDATNVIDRPAAAVITPVSMDHMEFLGDTITKIAGEKAGIIKRGCPAVFAEQSLEGRIVLEAEAERVRAGPLWIGGQDFRTYSENGKLIFQDTQGMMELPLPRLGGQHQHLNAGTAIAGLRAAFGDEISEAAIARGLQTVEWPGRLQLLRGNVLRYAPAAAEIWLDGGHNEDGGRVLSAAMEEMQRRNPRPLVMIAGMLSTKDSTAFLSAFQRLSPEVLAIGIAGQDAARSADDVADQARKAGLSPIVAGSLADALSRVGDKAWEVAPRVLITGSLYLAGEALKLDGTTPS